jgi:hypothetical protein
MQINLLVDCGCGAWKRLFGLSQHLILEAKLVGAKGEGEKSIQLSR